jgi:glycosyltransferase involved in cell wall biosynthesis
MMAGQMHPAVDATVVICTWNRAALLAESLEILCDIRVPPDLEWECLVVNNNCTDGTDDVLASFAGRLPLRRLFEPNPGISRARNHAAREARGDLVLWMDDDIHVDRDWLAAYAEAAGRWPEATYFGGRIAPLYRQEPHPFVTDNLETFQGLLGIRDFGLTERLFTEGENPYGGNMAMRRSVFEKWMFDEKLGHRHAERLVGEETAFFDGLRQQGQNGVWVPAARVRHVIAAEQLSGAGVRRHFAAFGRSLVRRGDEQRTWILSYPRWLCRGYCLLTRARIRLLQLIGSTMWVPLLARCATWEGMLDEVRAVRVSGEEAPERGLR